MLNLFDFTQLACRASNLPERLIILKQLTDFQGADFQGTVPLDNLELQAVNQNLETLFPRAALAKGEEQGPFYRLKRQAIKRSLRHYRWVEKNLGELSELQQQVFTKVHAPWLPIYQQAIAQVTTKPLTNLLQGDPKQGCLPFLKLIETEVTDILAAVAQDGIDISIHPQIVASVQHCFWQKVQVMVASAMVADACRTHETPEELQSAAGFHAFYVRFPVLARWLAQISSDFIDLIRQAITRLRQDSHEISQQFWDGVAIVRIVNCQFTQSSGELEEQPTILVDFGLANGQTKRLSYYPFSLKAEVALQQLYAVLSDPQTNIPLVSIVSKQGYGYMVSSQPTSDRALLEQFEQMGRYLAIRQLLGNQRGLWGKLQLGIAQEELFLEKPKPLPEAVDVKAAIELGFESVDGWFRTQPHQAAHALNLYFAGTTARLCHRPTDTYLKLLKQVQSAEYLANSLAIDAVFRTLMEHPCPWDTLGELAQLEVKMLWQFKVLWLTVPMNHRYLLYDAEHALFTKLPLSPLEYLARRVQHIGSRRGAVNLNRNEFNRLESSRPELNRLESNRNNKTVKDLPCQQV